MWEVATQEEEILLFSSKECHDIHVDRYWSNPSMIWKLINAHFSMHFNVLFFYFEVLWSTRNLLNIWNPPLFLPPLGAYSLPSWLKPVNVNEHLARKRAPWLPLRWSPWSSGAGVGQVYWKKNLSVSSLYCPSLPAKPSFSEPHRGLFNPQHLSHFTHSWSRLVWQAAYSVQNSETASRHLTELSSVIVCVYSLNLFLRILAQQTAGVFALSLRECLRRPALALTKRSLKFVALIVSRCCRIKIPLQMVENKMQLKQPSHFGRQSK